MEKIFLTGITGLVGSAFVVALLRERQDYEIVCLARKTAVKSAQQRTEEIIRDECKFDGCPELADRILKSVKVIEGDVTTIDPEELAKNPLLAGTTIIFHCAADVNLGKDPTGRTYRINYNGTVNMVKLAQLLKVKEFHYVGTAYIAGKLVGTAFENMPIDNGFNNPYEESKFKAEMLVRNSGIPFTIYRPAIITGRRSDGRIRKRSTAFLNFWANSRAITAPSTRSITPAGPICRSISPRCPPNMSISCRSIMCRRRLRRFSSSLWRTGPTMSPAKAR